jgi:hypothetical protein
MKVPENRRGQKTVPGETIVVGDWIYRPTTEGDYMMIVGSVSRGTDEGLEVFVFCGDVFKVTGDGAGPQAAFLGDIQMHLAGASEWYLPIGKKITKGTSLEESDWRY